MAVAKTMKKTYPHKWKQKSGSKTYFAWRSMRSRCMNPKHPSFENYGGRGIYVCKEWANDFDKFYADMGEAPKGHSLDRINNNDGYFPQNCRWATVEQQLNNRSNNRIITFGDETKTAAQWAKSLNIRPDTLHKRLLRMPPADALKTNIKQAWQHGTRSGYEWHKCRCQECREFNNQRAKDSRSKRKLK